MGAPAPLVTLALTPDPRETPAVVIVIRTAGPTRYEPDPDFDPIESRLVDQ